VEEPGARFQRRTLTALIASTYLAGTKRAARAVRSVPCLAAQWVHWRKGQVVSTLKLLI
jgi:hypothetical protein